MRIKIMAVLLPLLLLLSLTARGAYPSTADFDNSIFDTSGNHVTIYPGLLGGPTNGVTAGQATNIAKNLITLSNDLAVLKVSATNLVNAPNGPSQGLNVSNVDVLAHMLLATWQIAAPTIVASDHFQAPSFQGGTFSGSFVGSGAGLTAGSVPLDALDVTFASGGQVPMFLAGHVVWQPPGTNFMTAQQVTNAVNALVPLASETGNGQIGSNAYVTSLRMPESRRSVWRTAPRGSELYAALGGNATETNVWQAAQTANATLRWKQPGGYWVGVPDGWQGGHDSSGNIYCNSNKYPHGLAWLASVVHTNHCFIYPYHQTGTNSNVTSFGAGFRNTGGQGFFAQDATNFVNWGMDGVRLDAQTGSVGSDPTENTRLARDAALFAAHLELAAGHPLPIYSSGWDPTWPIPQGVVNVVQILTSSDTPTSSDPNDTWTNFLGHMQVSLANAQRIMPASWISLDYILMNMGQGYPLIGAIFGASQFEPSPQTFGSCAACYALETNQWITAVQSDVLGAPPELVSSNANWMILKRPLAWGGLAVCMINTTTNTTQSVGFTADDLGYAPGASLSYFDVIGQTNAATGASLTNSIGPYTANMWIVSPTLPLNAAYAASSPGFLGTYSGSATFNNGLQTLSSNTIISGAESYTSPTLRVTNSGGSSIVIGGSVAHPNTWGLIAFSPPAGVNIDYQRAALFGDPTNTYLQAAAPNGTGYIYANLGNDLVAYWRSGLWHNMGNFYLDGNTPFTIPYIDSANKLASLANAAGSLTNDGAGNVGWFNQSWSGQLQTNLTLYTNATSPTFALKTYGGILSLGTTNEFGGDMHVHGNFFVDGAGGSGTTTLSNLVILGRITGSGSNSLMVAYDAYGVPFFYGTNDFLAATNGSGGSNYVTFKVDKLVPTLATASRIARIDSAGSVTNVGASSAQSPLNGDGSATVAADVQGLFSSALLTNYHTAAVGLTNAGNNFSGSYDSPTNTWGINTPFGLGTNAFITSGATTGGFTGIGNGPGSVERYGELTIVASGDITFTNPVSVRTSDMVSSRTITNGNTAVISVMVLPTFCTNMAICQFK